MARISIADIDPQAAKAQQELTEQELDTVVGGAFFSLSSPILFQPTMLYGSYSISKVPLSGISVTGVRG